MKIYLIASLLFLLVFLSGYLLLSLSLQKVKNTQLILSFSGAFLLSICIFHLLPEIFHNHLPYISYFLLGGFIIQIIIEFFSKGIEHGHIHVHGETSFPYVILIGLGIHSFIEGMALVSENQHAFIVHSEHPLLIGVLLHKIPIVFILISLFKALNISKTKSLFGLLFFSLSAPLGLYSATFVLSSHPKSLHYILALTVGVFLHISTTILFESSKNHKFNTKKFLIILLGFFIGILSTI